MTFTVARGCKRSTCGRNGLLADVQMRHETHGAGLRSAHSTPAAAISATSAGGVLAGRDGAEHDVGLDASGSTCRRREPASPSARRRALAWSSARRSTWWSHGVQGAGGDDAGLSHAAAQQLAVAARASRSARRRRRRPSRRARPGPSRSRPRRSRRRARARAGAAAGDGGVPEPRAVHVQAHAALVRRARAISSIRSCGQIRPPCSPMVFSMQIRCWRGVVLVGRVAQPRLQLDRGRARPRSPAIIRVCTPDNAATPPGLVDDHVRQLVHQHLVAGPALAADRDLVAHRAGGHVEGRLLAEHRRPPRAPARSRWDRRPRRRRRPRRSAIAARMAGVGRVTVSERRSIGCMAPERILSAWRLRCEPSANDATRRWGTATTRGSAASSARSARTAPSRCSTRARTAAASWWRGRDGGSRASAERARVASPAWQRGARAHTHPGQGRRVRPGSGGGGGRAHRRGRGLRRRRAGRAGRSDPPGTAAGAGPRDGRAAGRDADRGARQGPRGRRAPAVGRGGRTRRRCATCCRARS